MFQERESPSKPLEPHLVTPGERRRLQKQFDRAVLLSTSEGKPDHDAAHAMLEECVVRDPGNLLYVAAMLDNLERKHNRNKQGYWLPRFGGARRRLRKAAARQAWRDVLSEGPEALRSNPWDVVAILALAAACEAFGYREAELRYLKNALGAKPHDVEVNRRCAEALARSGRFDEAVACWNRVAEFGTAEDKQAAERKVSELSVDRAGGRRESSDEDKSDKDIERRRNLEAVIAENPADAGHYLSLADLLIERGRYDEAEALLRRGLAASGRSLAIVDRMEELHVARAAEQAAVAQRRASSLDTEDAWRLASEMRQELNRVELAFYSQRTQRRPDDRELQFELGLRLKRAGNYEEAAAQFANLLDDSSRAAAAALELGESLQHLRRYREALEQYVRAVALARDAEPDVYAKALERGVVLAAAMGKTEQAEALSRELEQGRRSERE